MRDHLAHRYLDTSHPIVAVTAGDWAEPRTALVVGAATVMQRHTV